MSEFSYGSGDPAEFEDSPPRPQVHSNETLGPFAAVFHSPSGQSTPYTEESAQVIDRDENYYFTDVIFLVDGSLFKVPRSPFIRTSEVFRDMFALPVPDITSIEGSSDENPVVLEGIEKTDFRLLLKVMFPVYPPDVEDMSRAEWLSVLKLAKLWQMDKMQKLAVKQILSLTVTTEDWIEMLQMSTSRDVPEIRQRAVEQLDYSGLEPVERILLGRECRIHEWLFRGLKELVTGNDIISKENESRLGMEMTVGLFRLSHQYWRNRRRCFAFDLDPAIRTEFEGALEVAGYVDPSKVKAETARNKRRKGFLRT